MMSMIPFPTPVSVAFHAHEFIPAPEIVAGLCFETAPQFKAAMEGIPLLHVLEMLNPS